MAKSIRSKRRQKVRSIRRKKFGEREAKKAWERFYAIQARKQETSKPGSKNIILDNILPMNLDPVSNDSSESTVPVVDMETEDQTGVKISRREIAKWGFGLVIRKTNFRKGRNLNGKKFRLIARENISYIFHYLY